MKIWFGLIPLFMVLIRELREGLYGIRLVKIVVNSSPWLIGGDFNVVMHSKEKWGKDNLNSYELEFQDCLNNLEVLI
jgi:hypothetical protein